MAVCVGIALGSSSIARSSWNAFSSPWSGSFVGAGCAVAVAVAAALVVSSMILISSMLVMAASLSLK